MPVTPEVARPIGRNASSQAVKRIDIPLRETSIKSIDESTSRAAMTSSLTPPSSSRKLMAIMPPERVES